jgi:hypothetical protein
MEPESSTIKNLSGKTAILFATAVIKPVGKPFDTRNRFIASKSMLDPWGPPWGPEEW